MANRAVTFLHRLFSLAIKWGWREGNPVVGVEHNAEQPRNRFLTASELGRLLGALNKIDDQQASLIFRLCLLTGCRKGEALSAT